MTSADLTVVHNVREVRLSYISEDEQGLYAVIIPHDVFLYIKKTIDGLLIFGVALYPTPQLATTVRKTLCECFSEHPFFQNLLLNGGRVKWINTKESESIFIGFDNEYILLTTYTSPTNRTQI